MSTSTTLELHISRFLIPLYPDQPRRKVEEHEGITLFAVLRRLNFPLLTIRLRDPINLYPSYGATLSVDLAHSRARRSNNVSEPRQRLMDRCSNQARGDLSEMSLARQKLRKGTMLCLLSDVATNCSTYFPGRLLFAFESV